MMQKLRILNRGIFFFLGLNKLLQTRIINFEMSNEKLNYWYAIGTAFHFKNLKPLGMFQVKGNMNLSALLDNF